MKKHADAAVFVEKQKMTDEKKAGIRIWLAVVFFCILCSQKVLASEGIPKAASGIIEVQSGFLDTKGKFWKMKSGSGILIANEDDGTYILTNCSNVSNTPGRIKKYCRKHSIDTQDMQFSSYIQVVVMGDVTAEAEVLVKSAEKDYCVLSAENVVSQKESLKLGDSEGIEMNDTVYAYGFPERTKAEKMQYSEAEVKEVRGTVTGLKTGPDSAGYIAHSALVERGFAGGPLLDSDGYVIGLNCKKPPDGGAGMAYALSINEIRGVLDNFSVYYGNRETDEAYVQLEELYQECMDIAQAGGYKQASIEVLRQQLTAAEASLREEKLYAADLQEAYQNLWEVKQRLVPKAGILTIAVKVFFVSDMLLFLWVSVLAVKEAKSRTSCRQPSAGNLQIIRKKTGQAVTVHKKRFVIGKSRKLTDYCIADNQTVSREHAVLFERNGSWYLDDLNSLNGTYINGQKIVPGQAARLKDGDEIALSDEVFLVQG